MDRGVWGAAVHGGTKSLIANYLNESIGCSTMQQLMLLGKSVLSLPSDQYRLPL